MKLCHPHPYPSAIIRHAAGLAPFSSLKCLAFCSSWLYICSLCDLSCILAGKRLCGSHPMILLLWRKTWQHENTAWRHSFLVCGMVLFFSSDVHKQLPVPGLLNTFNVLDFVHSIQRLLKSACAGEKAAAWRWRRRRAAALILISISLSARATAMTSASSRSHLPFWRKRHEQRKLSLTGQTDITCHTAYHRTLLPPSYLPT